MKRLSEECQYRLLIVRSTKYSGSRFYKSFHIELIIRWSELLGSFQGGGDDLQHGATGFKMPAIRIDVLKTKLKETPRILERSCTLRSDRITGLNKLQNGNGESLEQS